MNELRIKDLSDLDPLEAPLRQRMRMRPWHLPLPDDAKADATYRDGVLELRLPKRAAASEKRLQVA